MSALGRLAGLYRRLERMEAIAAGLAVAAANDAAARRGAEQAYGEQEQAQARTALLGGDRAGWLVAERAGDLSKARVEVLKKVQAGRERSRDAALARYLQSRLKTEQMTVAHERLQAQESVVETRREQAAADDRFGSRLGWMRARDEMKRR